MPDSATGAPKKRPLEDETSAALTLFNAYLIADREQQAQERALKKAQKAKDDAAAAVRKLNDRKAPTSEMAEAEARYREAAEALQRLRDGGTENPEDTPEDDNADDGTAATAGGSDTPAEEPESSTSDRDTATEETEDSTSETVDETSSVGVEASVDDEDLAGDEPAGVAGQQ